MPGEFDQVLRRGALSELQSHFQALDVKHAKASNEKDEKMIKELILNTISFAGVNEQVKNCLSTWLSERFRYKMLEKR